MTSSEIKRYVVSNAASQGASVPLVATRHPGTQVLYRWAIWQNQQRLGRPIRTGVFRKEDIRLVVYQYASHLCCVLKHSDIKPRFRDFREWRQSFFAVKRKLVQRGWSLVSDSGEVSHATH